VHAPALVARDGAAPRAHAQRRRVAAARQLGAAIHAAARSTLAEQANASSSAIERRRRLSSSSPARLRQDFGYRYVIRGLVPWPTAYESMGCGRDALRVTLA
jgi:hypothetical protein